MMGAARQPSRETSTCLRLTFTDPDLTTFLGLDALGLTAVGQLLTAERAVIECRMPIGFEDPFCRACGAQGVSRGTGGPAPGPCAGGVEAHAVGGTRAAPDS